MITFTDTDTHTLCRMCLKKGRPCNTDKCERNKDVEKEEKHRTKGGE